VELAKKHASRTHVRNTAPAQQASLTRATEERKEARKPTAERVGLVEPDDVLDAETEALIADGILTREEVAAIRVEAAAKVLTEQKAARKKAALARFTEQERRTAGLLKPEDEHQRWLNELVQVSVLLPSLKPAPGHGAPLAPDPIVLDGRPFYHGRQYTVTRSVALTLYDLMGRAARHHAQIAGESPAFYSASRGIYSQAGEVMSWKPQ
jgi:hypothetical protein